MNATLTSAPIDLSGFGPDDALRIELDQDFYTFLGGTTGEIDVWNGTDWVPVTEQTQTSTGHVVFGTQAANGVADARIRFVYIDAGSGRLVEDRRRHAEQGLGLPVHDRRPGLRQRHRRQHRRADQRRVDRGRRPARDHVRHARRPQPGRRVLVELGARRPGPADRERQPLRDRRRADHPAGQRRASVRRRPRRRVDPLQSDLAAHPRPVPGHRVGSLDVVNDGGADATVQFGERMATIGQRPNGPFAPSRLRVEAEGLREPDAAGDQPDRRAGRRPPPRRRGRPAVPGAGARDLGHRLRPRHQRRLAVEHRRPRRRLALHETVDGVADRQLDR